MLRRRNDSDQNANWVTGLIYMAVQLRYGNSIKYRYLAAPVNDEDSSFRDEITNKLFSG